MILSSNPVLSGSDITIILIARRKIKSVQIIRK